MELLDTVGKGDYWETFKEILNTTKRCFNEVAEGLEGCDVIIGN